MPSRAPGSSSSPAARLAAVTPVNRLLDLAFSRRIGWIRGQARRAVDARVDRPT